MSSSPSSAAVSDERVSAFLKVLSRFADRVGQKMLINLVALLILSLTLVILTDRFLTPANVTNILRQVAPVVIVGCPVTLLMVSRNFDLSVGGVVALSGIAAAELSQTMPIPAAFLIASALGGLVGLVNGILVVVIGVNAVIATLGTMYVSRGSALLITGGTPVYQVPKGYATLGAGHILGIPTPVWLMVAVLGIFLVLERQTLLGKYAISTGSNREAAYLCGVPVRKTQIILFTLSGLMAGVAGVMISSRLASGIPSVGVGFEFEVIVATVLGGTSLAGGEGSIIGMVVGAIIVGVLNNGLNLLGVPSFWQTVTKGVVLVAAVALDAALRRQRIRVRRGPSQEAAASTPAAAEVS